MARSFNGTSDYIETTANYGPGAVFQNCSFGCWFKLGSGPVNQVLMELADAQSGTPAGWTPLLQIESGVTQGYVYDGAGHVVSGANNADSMWHHALVCIRSGVSISLYVDGVLQGSATIGTAYAGYSHCYWRLGNGNSSSGPLGYFQGQMAHAAVWPGAVLDQSEISALADGVPPKFIRPAALAIGGYWPLDGLSSPELDWSGNGNHTILNGTTYADGPPQVRYPRPFLLDSPPLFVSAGGGVTFACNPGTFTLTGEPTVFTETLVASPGSFTLSGQATTFAEVLQASPGSFTLTGQSAVFSQVLSASPGSFVLNGGVSTFKVTFAAQPGTFTSTGGNAAFSTGNVIVFQCGPATFTLSGLALAFILSTPEPGKSATSLYKLIPSVNNSASNAPSSFYKGIVDNEPSSDTTGTSFYKTVADNVGSATKAPSSFYTKQ